jgi:hypothetical protein
MCNQWAQQNVLPLSLRSLICFPGSPTHDRYGSRHLSIRHYHVSSIYSGTLELFRIIRVNATQNRLYTVVYTKLTFASFHFICSSLSPKCPPLKCCVLAIGRFIDILYTKTKAKGEVRGDLLKYNDKFRILYMSK